ncbi:hypothetical protein K438DRAFT_1754100 [Mycena galopus ATCC 62051]|nr:hypothetical protein K438DRAFT_1754100 [Mycena galopus ATCC 62051]
MEGTIRPEFRRGALQNRMGRAPPGRLNPSTGKIVGDTFEIAQYLDEYPNGPRLIPPSITALHSAFNIHVDKIFTDGIVIFCAQGLSFNPQAAEEYSISFWTIIHCAQKIGSVDDLTEA